MSELEALEKLREMVEKIEEEGEGDVPIYTPTCGITFTARQTLEQVEQKTEFGNKYLQCWLEMSNLTK